MYALINSGMKSIVTQVKQVCPGLGECLCFINRVVVYNNRSTDLNGYMSIKDCTDFLSEGCIFANQQPHQ